MTHYNLVHKFSPMPQAIKNPRCKSGSGEGMEEARDDSSLATGECQKQEGGYL